MRGDDGDDEGVGQLALHVGRVQAGGVQQLEAGRQGALLRRGPLPAVVPAAALVVHVLGQVGQQGEVAERPDDVVGGAHVETGEGPGEPAAVDLGAADPERLDPGGLHHVEDRLAGLLPHHLAQHPAQQPDVLPQRGLVLRSVGAGAAQVGDVHGGFRHGTHCAERV